MRTNLLMIALSPLLLMAASVAQSAVAADPAASPATKAVLNYLAGLPNKTSQRLVWGQMGYPCDFDIYRNRLPAMLQNVYSMTGKLPGLVGTSFMRPHEPCIPRMLPQLIDHWNRGSLITITPEYSNPVTGGRPEDRTFVDAAQLLTPGTALNAAWNAELDRSANHLQVLENAGVVVLFRPFPEMNAVSSTGGFWWATWTAADVQLLWKYTFNYYTNTKGLHNLLWVYAPSANAGEYLNFYPGPQYVDVVGLDYYPSPSTVGRVPVIGGYAELLTSGKPFILAELGLQGAGCAVSRSHPTCWGGGAPKDLYVAIQDIKQNMPRTGSFLHWFDLDKQLNIQAALNEPWVVSGPIPFNPAVSPR